MVPILTEVKLTINRYPAIVQTVEDLNAPVSEEFKKRYSGGDVPPPKDGD
jgi:hypothetical protein